MTSQSFLEEFAGLNDGLQQSIYSFADLHVNIAIEDFFSKLIMFNYVVE